MIAHVSGTVASLGLTWVVIEVGGFGVHIQTTPSTAAALRLGEAAHLHTSLIVREDSLTLYGFSSSDERDAFELVQTASGVGPKLGLAICSVLPPARLKDAVLREDLAALCTVPGVGRKGAQKIVIELKDRVAVLGSGEYAPSTEQVTDASWRGQVSSGLQGLGWSAKDAETACDAIAPLVEENPEISITTLMRTALQTLARA